MSANYVSLEKKKLFPLDQPLLQTREGENPERASTTVHG